MHSFEQSHNDYLDPDIHNPPYEDDDLTSDGASIKLARLLDETFGRQGLAGWKKSVYKGTNCGASLDLEDPITIRLGSIVEGADECAEPITLVYPFEAKEIWDALEDIEEQCKSIWMTTHGCEDCFPDIEGEDKPVRLDCPTCKGQGIII